MTDVVRPSGLDGDSLVSQYLAALEFKSNIENAAQEHSSITVDLSSARWFTPTFLTTASVVVNSVSEQGCEVDVTPPNHGGVQHYLNMIDFPHGTSDPSGEYTNTLPLCTINTSPDENAIDNVAEKMRELMKKQIARDGEGITWLEYPFSEIIDNVDTHADCQYGSLLIQNYPNKEFLDICIADDGVSIPGSYERFGIEFDSEEDALRMALEEGISTRADTGGERGYGLRTTSEMICSGLRGEVLLSSNSTMLHRTGGVTNEHESRRNCWEGTVFAARIYPPGEDFRYHDYLYPD